MEDRIALRSASSQGWRMKHLRLVSSALCVAVFLAACSTPPSESTVETVSTRNLYPNETPELRALIVAAAQENEVPVSLVQRVVIRESTHQPEARNGPYFGLMQILPATARSMGFQGTPSDLLDAETNLRYAVRYLRGAWLVSDGDETEAVGWYARGYYYEAKRLGLLDETGVHGRKDWSD
jgi:soluble lytic murein transglycosylase-like protein